MSMGQKFWVAKLKGGGEDLEFEGKRYSLISSTDAARGMWSATPTNISMESVAEKRDPLSSGK